MRGVRHLLRDILFAAILATLAVPVHAQRDHRDRMERQQGERPQRFKPPSHLSHDERRQLRDDVNSARGHYDRGESRRSQRMAPEDREKLRQDIQEANRHLRRR
jgi:hypothetical protein